MVVKKRNKNINHSGSVKPLRTLHQGWRLYIKAEEE